MGLPVTVYRHTDVGAPPVATRTSEWIDVLKACLVTGYGSKSPLGWTLEFEGAYSAAFKNKTSDGGSGCFVRFSDVGGANSVSGYADINIAKGMSGIDVFTDRLQSRRIRFDSNPYYVEGWTIIGTSRGFWLIEESGAIDGDLNTTQGSWSFNYFIGDLQSFIPNDTAPFGIVSGVQTTGDSTTTLEGTQIGSGSKIHVTSFAADGGTLKLEYSYSYPNKATSSDGGDISATNVPAVLNPPMLFSLAGNGNPSFNFCRGLIPGLFELQHIGCRYVSAPIVKTFDGNAYQALRGIYTPVFWVKLSGAWYE
jgi:hypothetical protein